MNEVGWRSERFMGMAAPVMRSHEILSADTEELWEQNAEGS